MTSYLIDALLRGSPDYDPLFVSLSWPSETSPEPERVEALTAFIAGLGRLLEEDRDHCRFTAEKRRGIQVKIESIIWTLCLPLLARISGQEPGEAARGGSRESAAAACRLLGACIPLCERSVPVRLARSVLPSLQLSEEERPGRLGVEVASEVLAAVLPALAWDDELITSTVSTVLSCVKTLPDGLLSRVTARLLLALLGSCGAGMLASVLRLILDDLGRWHCSDPTPVVTERALMCVTAVSDHLLSLHLRDPPSSPDPDPRLCPQFWRMIQDGLTHRDSVCRKRALYLLKRCVALSEEQQLDFPLSPLPGGEMLFKWSFCRSKLLRDFWEDYALVMETLEENQVHVVRPVLNRIDTLIQTTVNNSQGECLFHPSWLLCVYQRMFHSENKSLMREGVSHLLELQVLQQPEFAVAFSEFIIGPFLDVLSESSLFNRSIGQSIGDCPEMGVRLEAFVCSLFGSLPPEHRGCVLLQLIQQLGSKQWCAVPLLFLSQALSKLPRSPLLGIEGLAALREVLCCAMITHQVLLRGAAQCFLLNTALCLTDVSAVSLDDVFSFLMHFRADESLCRGTRIWNQLCLWLLENEGRFKPTTADGNEPTGAVARTATVRGYVQDQIQAYLRVPASTGQSERLPDCKEADKLARAILLFADMERGRPETQLANTLESLLSPLLDTLSRVSTNIYLPLHKSDKSLQLVLRLLQLAQTPRSRGDGGEAADDGVIVAMEKLIYKVTGSVQEFFSRRLCGELQEQFDMERAELYLTVLRQLMLTFGSSQPHHQKVLLPDFLRIIKYSLRLLQETKQQTLSVEDQVAKAVAMASLATVCGLIEQEVMVDKRAEAVSALETLNDVFYGSALRNFNQRLMKPNVGDSSSDHTGLQPPLQLDWGRVAAGFMRDQWLCLSFLLKVVGLPDPGGAPGAGRAALICGMEALALLPSDLVLPVFGFMETLLPQLLMSEESLCAEAVALSWELVQGLSTNARDFWPALKRFISMAFQRELLRLSHTHKLAFVSTLKQISAELVELSQTKSGVFGVLLLHCCQTWLPTDGGSDHDDTVFTSLFSHTDMLTEACVYGPVFRKDQRLIQDVQAYVEQLSDDLVIKSDDRDDQFPRVCVLAFLSRLDPSNQQHERVMEELALALLKKDYDISKSKVRCYNNSLQHRVKNRVWQTLLLLLPRLREEFVSTLLSGVFEAGFCSNQASVKYLIEWMMILILVRYPQHMDSFWACFNTDHEKTKTSICTFLSVLVHFNLIIPKLQDKAAHLHRALDVILQWCFNHNFSVRLYALLALKRVWSLAENSGADSFRGLSTVIKACLNQAETMQSAGNANKNWIRIQEHFFFGAFHPIRDYSAETILYIFPSLSELADDEWIPTWKFEKLTCFSDCPSLPLRNAAPDLSRLQPGDWIQQDRGEQDKEERWAEVQKKITPWRLGIQEQEPELQLVPPQRAARLGKLHGALLVVASLIDKPTNLGGLCRTCEIFGASALVLDNLRHISDKHFQSLSVSSELWLPLLEVKPVELSDFLQVKKGEGYCIVGVEQTANSQSLQDYRFPEKTLLLLGNEREGIPANLLQMLDVCVEIPQQGVVRSLNVHVSAALLIWEYTRQHLAPGSAQVKCN